MIACGEAALCHSRLYADRARYPQVVAEIASPTSRLLAGLAITLTVVTVFSVYTAQRVQNLRQLQRDIIDRNRRDSLQLLRIQNNLNSLGLAMRDMLEGAEPYPLTAWTAQFQRIRADLDDALHREASLATGRPEDQQRFLISSFEQFWDAMDRMFAAARAGDEAGARSLLRNSLTARLSALTNSVARLLVHNNESEERAAGEVTAIYERVERDVYLFLAVALAAVVVTSAYLIQSNRRLFQRLAALSRQRSELAQKLITMQEETLRSVSRELHDEFGQVLTAVGAMLRHVEKQGIPADSPLSAQLVEVRQVTQDALDRVRTLSQMLHPVMLEEMGLEGALEWYLPQFEKQTSIKVGYEKTVNGDSIDRRRAVHIYRVLQEALNNVARHSGAQQAWVRLSIAGGSVNLEVEDHGRGLPTSAARKGMGMVAMRERAVLLRGSVEFSTPAQGGTLVTLSVPSHEQDA